MRAMPFAFDEFSFTRSVMGVDCHLIPQMHVLFFGPIECARHSFSSLVDDEDASILVVMTCRHRLARRSASSPMRSPRLWRATIPFAGFCIPTPLSQERLEQLMIEYGM